MGQRLAAMRAQRQGGGTDVTADSVTDPNSNSTLRQETVVASNMITASSDANSSKAGFLLGGEEEPPKETLSDETIRNSEELLNSIVKIELVPHQHTLFCERKERVCTAAGKLQERETLMMVGDVGKLTNIVWIRSKTRNIMQGAPIPASEGKTTYELSSSDVDCYIGVQAALKDGPETAFRHNCTMGPILAGPARLLGLGIKGTFAVGNVVIAMPEYIGGIEGASEFWWLRVNKGKRENVFEPKSIDAGDNRYTAAKAAMDQELPVDVDWLRKSGIDINQETLDPRIYVLTESDIGCELKVKCRPVRADGVRGEVFTSKACPKILSAAETTSSNKDISNTDSSGGDGTVSVMARSEGVLL